MIITDRLTINGVAQSRYDLQNFDLMTSIEKVRERRENLVRLIQSRKKLMADS